ncbi:pilin [Vibrio sp. TH_r3]|uniref:pilin n=1 Tax=Vibrio sp. TH_r3 TaxID=3082084 RepID=UPI002954A993|nr:pilin [Vibrio sp. TH_r3]MDV7104461.1 pilin [Vibrio sp. TH_r3]
MKHLIKRNSGFTLIELMIVVAVIGVLSSIAIPQYQNYIKKSQLGAALATISALKINIEDYLATNGQFPALTNANISAQLGSTTSPIGDLESKSDANAQYSGQIILTMNDSTQFKDKNIALQREQDGSWSCVTDITDSALLPKHCTTDTIL